MKRSTRQHKAPNRYAHVLHYLLLSASSKLECYDEALHSNHEASGS